MPAISEKAKKQITKQIDLVVKKYLQKASDSSGDQKFRNFANRY